MTDILAVPLDDHVVPITFTSGGEHVEPTPTKIQSTKSPTPPPTPEGMAVVSAALADIVSRTEGPTPQPVEPTAPPATPSPTSAETDVVSAALADQIVCDSVITRTNTYWYHLQCTMSYILIS